jgi:hypothetical protein
MRDTLKIFLAKWRLDDTGAAKALLLPLQHNGNVAKMLSERQTGFSYEYEEGSRVGRFIASDGATVMGFKVIGVSRQEAAMIAAECKHIEIWDMYEFRKAADRALGASANP